jgi:MFS family permease
VETAARTGAFGALRNRDFRLLWAGQTVSLLGDAAFLTALGWRTFTLFGASRFGFVLAADGAAMLASVLIGGALADRYDRRFQMIVSDIWRFGAVGALAALDATGHLAFGTLLGLAMLVGLGNGFFMPAFGGIVPLVVETAHLGSANTLIGLSRYGGFLLGPGLASVLYGWAGSPTVFALDAVSFLVSAALLTRARPRLLDPAAAHESTFDQIREGVRYVARVPWLWVTIVLFAFVLMFQLAPQQVLLPKLVRQHFDRGVGAYGLLTTLFGAGMVLGTLLFGRLGLRRRRGAIAYLVWGSGSLLLVAVALTPSYWSAAVLMLVRGGCVGFTNVLWETIVMELVPERLLSRVYSLDYFGSFGLLPVGLLVAALVAPLAAPGTIIAAGACAGAALFAFGLTRPWLRAVD